MQLCHRRYIPKEAERMTGNLDLSKRNVDFVVGLQMVLHVIGQFERVHRRQWREEHVLGGDQDTALNWSLISGPGRDLGDHIAAAIRWRRAFIFLDPIRRQRVSHAKILVMEHGASHGVSHGPAFWQWGYGVTGARPSAPYQNVCLRRLCLALRVAG